MTMPSTDDGIPSITGNMPGYTVSTFQETKSQLHSSSTSFVTRLTIAPTLLWDLIPLIPLQYGRRQCWHTAYQYLKDLWCHQRSIDKVEGGLSHGLGLLERSSKEQSLMAIMCRNNMSREQKGEKAVDQASVAAQ